MKKVGILTLHRCINYGAYWQVRCLTDFFTEAGHDVEVLDYGLPGFFYQEVRHALRPLRPAGRRDVIWLMAKTWKFVRAQQRINRTTMFSPAAPPDFSDRDLIVVGSDEVWNLNHPWLGGLPLFFGENLKPKRLVSYAATFGNYDATRGLSPEWVRRLRQFDRISVRDLNSSELVDRHLGRKPPIVLDPCLQFVPAPRAARPLDFGAPYVLVYGNRFTPALAAEARQWAAAQRLRIVSIGYRNDWADISVLSAGPDDFVRAFQSATAVVTSYFHGCVFALQFHRPFVAQLSDYRANKIAGLLLMVNAGHRIFGPAQRGRLAELLSTPVEPEVLSSIAEHRASSRVFLDACLE